jgi:hypothetical protein
VKCSLRYAWSVRIETARSRSSLWTGTTISMRGAAASVGGERRRVAVDEISVTQ